MIHRIEHLRRTLDREGLGGALIRHSRDVFYYTGAAQPSTLVVLPETHRLFVSSGMDRALQDTFLDTGSLSFERHMPAVFGFMSDHGLGEGAAVGTEPDILPAATLERWKRLAPTWDFRDVSPAVLAQRQIKEPGEVARIEQACRVLQAGHQKAMEVLREGISELELSVYLERAHRLAGHEGAYFMRMPDFSIGTGFLASGANVLACTGIAFSLTGAGLGPALPAGASRRVIRNGDLVLVDMPAMVGGYHADQTRMYHVGEVRGDLLRWEEHLVELFDHFREVTRPGRTWGDCFRDVIARASLLGVQDLFGAMEDGSRLHYVAHGVGLELNEPPLVTARNDSPVRPGTVLAVEMQLLERGRRALKFEDMLLVGKDGNRFLSATPRKLFRT